MGAVDITGFQRRRKLVAAKAAQALAEKAAQETPQEPPGRAETPPGDENTNQQPNEQQEPPGEPQEQPDEQPPTMQLTVEEIDAMDLETVRSTLNAHNVSFTHNTGEAKLKAKLKEVFGHVE